MLQRFLNQNIFIYCMTGICLLGILSRIIVNHNFKKNAYAAENMGLSNKKFLRNIKTKFENSFKLNLKVNNIGSFVDKSVAKQKICGISASRWNNFNLQAAMACYIIGIAGAFYQMINNQPTKEIATTAGYGIFMGAILLFVQVSLRSEVKRDMLSTNIKDYLENYLQNQLMGTVPARGEKVIESLETVPNEKSTEAKMSKDMEYLKACLDEIASTKDSDLDGITPKEKLVIEEILQDFFS